MLARLNAWESRQLPATRVTTSVALAISTVVQVCSDYKLGHILCSFDYESNAYAGFANSRDRASIALALET